jgi:hypothetical protein
MSSFTRKLSLYLRLRTRRWGYLLQKIPVPGKWVFIVGCYNSGTTLLHDLLAQHPMVGAMPNEGQFFTNQLMTGEKAGVRRLWAQKPDAFRMNAGDTSIDVAKLKKQWAYFYNDPSRPVLIEKTIANAARTRWLQQNFQPAYFICLFRNGYAVAEGIHRKENHPVETAIAQWKISNEILLGDMQELNRKIQISYEDLTASPEFTMQKITAFLGLDNLPDSLFSQSYKIHEMHSSIRNMNEESIKRLTPSEIEIINSSASETLLKLGYPLL